jgi:hypothetical protein
LCAKYKEAKIIQNIFGSNSDDTVQHVSNVFNRLGGTLFSIRSLITLVVSVGIALVLGRILAAFLRRIVWAVGHQADKTANRQTVTRLRRIETMMILSIAILRTLLVVFALYFWWQFVHPAGQPTALIGASALAALLLSGALSSPLRDIASGSLMMAEQWYGVGDHVVVEPFVDLQGVVERVTLRSTRIRGLNGEIIWVNNQNITGIRVAPRGIRTIGLELFVTDPEKGERLIEKANKRLPAGPLLVVKPLTIAANEPVGENLWHITAIAETAPGREWLIENSAVDLIKDLDANSTKPIIAHGPLARFADRDADRRFIRSIRNAQKVPVQKRTVRETAKSGAKKAAAKHSQKKVK